MKNIVLITVMLYLSAIGYSQKETSENTHKFRFGFNLGVSYSNLQSKESLPDNATIANGPGFRFGALMDYSISENLLISPKAELSFNNSSIVFVNHDNSDFKYKILPASLDLMLHVVYKIGKSKAKPYFLIGPDFKLPISKKGVSPSDFKTNPDLAIDIGVGLESKTKCFILAPEIRYSYGLLNVNSHPALQIMNFHNISLVLNFK